MPKEKALRIIKLLAGLEVAGLMSGKNIPDHLYEELDRIIAELSKEILDK